MYEKQKSILLHGLPNDIKDKMRDTGAMIAGGAVRSVFAGEKISDYDMYFRDYGNSRDFLLYMSESDDFKLVFSTELAQTFSDGKITIQVITMQDMTCDPEELLSKFDFTICMGLYDFSNSEFLLDSKFLPDLSRRDIIFNINTPYPISSLFRVAKYINKGYRISGLEIIKAALCINKLEIVSYRDVKKQIMGVDTVFLKPFLDRLDGIDKDKKFDSSDFFSLFTEYYYDELSERF